MKPGDVEDLPPFDPATQQTMARMNLAQAEHFLESNPKAIVLDVRSREDYDTAHLSGAVFFPFDLKKASIEAAQKSNPDFTKKKVYFLYGSKDNFYSIEVALRLIASGHQHIFVLNGGIEDWIKKGLPVMSTATVQ